MILDFHATYNDLLFILIGEAGLEPIAPQTLKQAAIEINERTSEEVAVYNGGVGFAINMSESRLPLPHCRKVFFKSVAVEVAWMLTGKKDIGFLQKYKVPFWDKFTEPGTNNIEAAYGYRWRHHFGRDQLLKAVEALRKDPSDRQVVICAWDPGSDALGSKVKKNVPCPVMFILNIVDGQLHMTLVIRSSDMFVGLPYDIMGYALLMKLFATSLQVPLGIMHVTLAHAHIYMKHKSLVLTALDNYKQSCWVREVNKIDPPMPEITLEQALEDPDNFIEQVLKLSKEARQTNLNLKPEVFE